MSRIKHTDDTTYKLEADLTKKVKETLMGTPMWEGWKASDRFHPGVSDFIGCYYGAFCAIELKAEDGVPSMKQLQFITNVSACGGYGIIVDTVGQVKTFLKFVRDDLMRKYRCTTLEELKQIVLSVHIERPEA